MKKTIIGITLLVVAGIIQGFALRENGTYTSQDPLKESIERGTEIYTDFCMQCHMAAGEGVPKTFPPLAKSDWLLPENITKSIHAIKYGLQGPVKVNGEDYDSAMVPLGLEDEEIADVMNYILNNWGNSAEKMVTTEDVIKIEK